MLGELARKEAVALRASISDRRALLDAAIGHMKTTLGWDTAYFNDGGPGDKLLEAHGLSEVASRNKAFAVKGLRVIFIDRSTKNKVRPYLHEVAHIVLKHDFDALSAKDEIEANEFADYLLKRHPSKYQIMAISCAVLLAISLILHIPGVLHPKTGHAVPVSGSHGATDQSHLDDKVIITASGEKYHRANCGYIQNKTNIQEITIEQADKLGKDPCSVCNP